MRRILIAFTFLLAMTAEQAEAQRTFRKGPYLQAVSDTGITVMWEDAGVGGRVLYRGADGVERTLDVQGGPVREARLSGLSRSAPYSYSVESSGQVSDESEFVTAPGVDEPFTFLIYGDNRSDHDQHRQVVEAMVVEGGDFAVNTGDMVSSGEEEDDWQRFFEIEYELIRNVPIFAAIGNHEEHDGDADLYLKYFAPPQQSSGREEFYAFTYGNTRFIVMDTHVKTILGGPDFEQGAWLDEELGADDPAIEHKFIVLHHGPYSSKPGRSGNLGVNVFWMDKFLDAGVDMVLSGHDHYYERGEDQRGMRYAIVGGGGAPLYDTDGPGNRGGREIFVSDSILSYVTMTIFGGRVEGCAKDTAGVVIECFSWGEGAIPDEPGPEPDPVPDPTPDPAAEPDPSPDGDPEQVECLDNVDCQGRDDMAHCAGMWVCIGQACGWSCDQVAPDPDPTPDAQPDVDPGEEPQPGPDADPGDGKDPGEDPGIGGEEDELAGGDPGTFGGQRDGDVGPRIDDVPSKGSGSSDCSTAAGSWAAALRGLVRR